MPPFGDAELRGLRVVRKPFESCACLESRVFGQCCHLHVDVDWAKQIEHRIRTFQPQQPHSGRVTKRPRPGLPVARGSSEVHVLRLLRRVQTSSASAPTFIKRGGGQARRSPQLEQGRIEQSMEHSCFTSLCFFPLGNSVVAGATRAWDFGSCGTCISHFACTDPSLRCNPTRLSGLGSVHAWKPMLLGPFRGLT